MVARPILARIARTLREQNLEVVLIGNAAAALQGAPVTTIDFDFMFRKTPLNQRKLRAVAKSLGAVLFRPFYPASGLHTPYLEYSRSRYQFAAQERRRS